MVYIKYYCCLLDKKLTKSSVWSATRVTISSPREFQGTLGTTSWLTAYVAKNRAKNVKILKI